MLSAQHQWLKPWVGSIRVEDDESVKALVLLSAESAIGEFSGELIAFDLGSPSETIPGAKVRFSGFLLAKLSCNVAVTGFPQRET